MRTRFVLAGSLGILIVSFIAGILIGHFGIKKTNEIPPELAYYEQLIQDEDNSILSKIVDQISIDNLKYHLKYNIK